VVSSSISGRQLLDTASCRRRVFMMQATEDRFHEDERVGGEFAV
jgi:hypothetical protein